MSGDAPLLATMFPEAAILGRRLSSAGLTIAVAESCTGGLLAAVVTAIPGSSAYVRGGLVVYADVLKTELLGVPAAVIAEQGAVSETVARLMAAGTRRRCGTDIGVAITGIAGPGSDATAKEVGLIHVAVLGPGDESRHVRLTGDRGREENRARAVHTALRAAIN